MIKKLYRVQISIQEYDSDGFWDIFSYLEVSTTKKQLQESITKIYNKATDYTELRVE